MPKTNLSKKARREGNLVELYCGDCLDVLGRIPAKSVDLFCSDPPYLLGILGKEWDRGQDFTPIWRKVLRTMKPGAFAYIMTSPRQDSFPKRIEELTEAGFKTAFYPFYWTYANGFPKAHSVAKALDKKEGRERKVVCRNPNSRENCTKDNTIFRSGTVGKTDYITVGDSPLEGSYAGSQPKPAVEVIVVAMKPLNERTYEAQAKANGHGITWMDDCRIPYDAEAPASQRGRFPATLLVSDNILDNGRKPGQGHWPKTKSTGFGKYGGGKSEYHGTGPKSTAENYSSYFSLDAWAERNLPFLIVPKPSKREKKLGLDGANPHCTIKPIQLMSYLITMGSRPGDVVLDCFLGSGTTGIAARRLGRRFIGIEIDPGYFQAAKKRMDAWMRQIA